LLLFYSVSLFISILPFFPALLPQFYRFFPSIFLFFYYFFNVFSSFHSKLLQLAFVFQKIQFYFSFDKRDNTNGCLCQEVFGAFF